MTIYGAERIPKLKRQIAAILNANFGKPCELENGERVLLVSCELATSLARDTCVEAWFFAENLSDTSEPGLFVRLNAAESERFLAEILDPRPPNNALLEAARRYRARA